MPAKVLIIEDDEKVARVVQQGLVYLLNAETMIASTIADALQKIGADPPDVVMLDLSLPDATGLQGLQAIHGLHPEIPVVIITGNADHGVRDDSMTHGAFGFLPKGQFKTIDVAEMVARAAIHRKVARDYDKAVETLKKIDETLANMQSGIWRNVETSKVEEATAVQK